MERWNVSWQEGWDDGWWGWVRERWLSMEMVAISDGEREGGRERWVVEWMETRRQRGGGCNGCGMNEKATLPRCAFFLLLLWNQPQPPSHPEQCRVASFFSSLCPPPLPFFASRRKHASFLLLFHERWVRWKRGRTEQEHIYADCSFPPAFCFVCALFIFRSAALNQWVTLETPSIHLLSITEPWHAPKTDAWTPPKPRRLSWISSKQPSSLRLYFPRYKVLLNASWNRGYHPWVHVDDASCT